MFAKTAQAFGFALPTSLLGAGAARAAGASAARARTAGGLTAAATTQVEGAPPGKRPRVGPVMPPSGTASGVDVPSPHFVAKPFAAPLGTAGGPRIAPAQASDVASMMAVAAKTVRTTRDATASLDGAGVLEAFGGLSGVDKARAIELARRNYDFDAVKPRMYRNQFHAFVTRNFPGKAAMPVRFVELRAFVSAYVCERGNKASNLSDMISGLRRGTSCVGDWDVSDTELAVVKGDARWLVLMYPSAPVVTRALSVEERVLFYGACAAGGAEGALARAIVKMGVSGQMRFEEVIGLWEEDVTFGEHGVLMSVVRDKTHKTTLTPYPRVCPRYPPWFGVHDAWVELNTYRACFGPKAPRGLNAPRAQRPFFTKLELKADGYRASEEPLDAPYVRRLLLRFLTDTVGGDASDCLNLHCFRSTGFNDIANKLYLGRVAAAEAGGWTEGGCIAQSYQRRTAMDLSCSIYIELLRVCDLLGRARPP